MNAGYLKRLRRLLLLLPAAGRAAREGRGVPAARALALTGARHVGELVADIESVQSLWSDPATGEDAIGLFYEEGEFHLAYGTRLDRPLAFSLGEGAVLLAALEPAAREAGKPARDTVRKLRQAIPEPLRARADQLMRGLDVPAAPPAPWGPPLQEAIQRRLEVTLEYLSVRDAAPAPRAIEPRALFQRDGAWYLAAWNVEKAEEHLYRLDRIAGVTVGARVFGRHQGPPLQRYARALYFASGAEREVTLRLTGSAARQASAAGARPTPHADGSVSVVRRVTPGNWLLGLVLGHGGEATVESPADVRAELRQRVDELAKLYR
ncbi:MAG: WYL domain-containing protein [Anaeromyxobacter sp.]